MRRQVALLYDAHIVQNAPQVLRNFIRYVFLDRDGVINRKMPEGCWVTKPDELVLCPGAAEAIATLNQAGIQVLVVTNQRGMALGLYDEAGLAAIHAHLRSLLAAGAAHLDSIYFCPHERDSCTCRKPKPGLFLRAYTDFPGAHAGNSLTIGDSLSDIEAGRGLGMRTVWIEGEGADDDRASAAVKARALADFTAASLAAFVDEHFPIDAEDNAANDPYPSPSGRPVFDSSRMRSK